MRVVSAPPVSPGHGGENPLVEVFRLAHESGEPLPPPLKLYDKGTIAAFAEDVAKTPSPSAWAKYLRWLDFSSVFSPTALRALLDFSEDQDFPRSSAIIVFYHAIGFTWFPTAANCLGFSWLADALIRCLQLSDVLHLTSYFFAMALDQAIQLYDPSWWDSDLVARVNCFFRSDPLLTVAHFDLFVKSLIICIDSNDPVIIDLTQSLVSSMSIDSHPILQGFQKNVDLLPHLFPYLRQSNRQCWN
jgi:hypothetical protein